MRTKQAEQKAHQKTDKRDGDDHQQIGQALLQPICPRLPGPKQEQIQIQQPGSRRNAGQDNEGNVVSAVQSQHIIHVARLRW